MLHDTMAALFRSVAPKILALAGLCALHAVSGCSEESKSRWLRPVRLLTLESQESLLLFEQTFESSTDLADWFLIDRTTHDLVPAAGARGVSIEDGLLTLDRPGSSLVTFLRIPAGQLLRVSVTTDLGRRVASNSPCHRLCFPIVQRLDSGADGAAELARWRTPRALRPAHWRNIVKALLRGLLVGPFRWESDPDESGLSTARIALAARETDEIRALFIPHMNGPRRLSSLRLTRLPKLGGPGREFVEAGAGPQEPELRAVRLEGEVRTVALVPAGGRFLLDLEARDDLVALSVGTALVSGAPEGAKSAWKIELETDGIWRSLGHGSLDRRQGEDSGFGDQLLDWPDSALAATRIRFSCQGDWPVLFGAPQLLVSDRRERRPNLLLISVDTLRADHLGAYGYRRPTSPKLDAFASGATLFENCFSVAPYTLPAHATMLTGLFPPKHGAVDHSGLDTSRVGYLPKLLAAAGYATSAFTASGFLSEEFGFAAGFDRYGVVDPIEPGDDDLAGLYSGTAHHPERGRHSLGAAARWIEARRRQHWFTFIHTFATHEYDPPEADRAPFDSGARGGWTEVLRARLMKHNSWVADPPDELDVQHLVDLYDATIHYTDRMLGQFLDHLESRGLLDNTLVVLTSDHGEEFYEHGALRHSVTMYDEMLHVPLLIRLPGQTAGRRVLDPFSQVDLLPTLLELLGLPPLEQQDGFARAGLLRGKPGRGRAAPIFAHVQTHVSRRESLRRGRFKIIHNDLSPELQNPGSTEWELYDLRADRLEQVNLAGRPGPGLQSMSEHLAAVRALIWAGAVEGRQTEISAELAEQLRQLGYLDGQ